MSKRILAIPIVLAIAAGFGLAIQKGSREFQGYPLTWWLITQAFLIQVVAFIPAVIFNTQMFYDLTGSLTFLSMMAVSIISNQSSSYHQYAAALMVTIWSARLGTFLFLRILQAREDKRFRQIKKSKIRFFVVWLLQGLWAIIPTGPAIVVLSQHSKNKPFNSIELVGIAVWVIGFLIQSISDRQKSQFNSKPENKGKFINQGLWKYSRHPNYVGEVLVWTGITIFSIPTLNGAQYVTLISPLFMYLLLMKVSGVPMLQRSSDKKWGTDPLYAKYKRQTPVLFPFGKGDEVVIPSEKKEN